MSYEYYEMMAENGGWFPYQRPPSDDEIFVSLASGKMLIARKQTCCECGKPFYPNQFSRKKVERAIGGVAHSKCLRPKTRVVVDWGF